MTDTRTTDLAAAELVRDGSGIVRFGEAGVEARAALGGDAVFDLQHLALITVDGDEAEEFLQGQLTNDVAEIGEQRAQQSAWCSPKGRVLTGLLVFRHDGRLLLQLPGSLLEQTLKRMRMFVLRAHATLEDASASWMRMGAIGDNTAARLRDLLGPLPENTEELRAIGGVTVIRLRGQRPRYELLGSHDAIAKLWNACREVAVAAGADAWELLDIEAGVASIGPTTSDAFVPQMINLDRIGGVSFTKGCYVGQEIVARTQHLGSIKRRMYRVHWSGGSPIGPGDKLNTSADPASPKAQVVNAQALPEGGFALLAVMPIEAAGNLPASAAAPGDGSQLTLRALPYALQDESG